LEETIIMSAEGQQEILELMLNKVRFKAPNYEFEIFLDKITAILFIHATGIVPGSLEIYFPGAGLLQHKYNPIVFTEKQQPEFIKMREAIESVIFQFGDK